MQQAQTSKVALALVGLTALSLMIGVFNAVNSHFIRSDLEVKGGKGDGIISLLEPSGKKSHLMLVDVSGPIMMDSPNEGGLFSEDSMAVSARKALDWAAKDESVKGVLLRVNSPGGTVGMSQELNAAVKRVVKEKPVVVTMGDMAASGGYYTACAADYIFANSGTLTASIGVIINTMNLKGFVTDKLGVQAVTIKSGKFKDILSPYRPAAKEEIALIQRLINESYQDFLGAVLAGRTRFETDPVKKKDLSERIKAVADGRIVSGEQALKAGLVDAIGDIYAAREKLDAMAKERFHISGKDQLPLEEYSESSGLLSLLGLSSLADHLMPKAKSHPAVEILGGLMPFSAQHPNQPLWIVE
jgi:signal peptide peptidase SppA